MSNKKELRQQRNGTVINLTSKGQEKMVLKALDVVVKRLQKRFKNIKIVHEPYWLLKDIIRKLKIQYPDVDFKCYHEKSSMKPDGGILSIVSKNGYKYPILIIEKKNQGTNDLRASEGKKRQAQGNAIERLGKNVIGFRVAMMQEAIFPFICFGDGCDFCNGSSILDRVVTIAMFGQLNKEYLHNIGPSGIFNRGTFYFRDKVWKKPEIEEISYSIAEKSVFYYFSKYSDKEFI